MSVFRHVRSRTIERRREQADTPAARASANAYTSLDEVLAEMRAALVGQGEAEIEAARTKESEAVSVELLSANLTAGARTAAGAWAARKRPEIGTLR